MGDHTECRVKSRALARDNFSNGQQDFSFQRSYSMLSKVLAENETIQDVNMIFLN